VTCFHAEIAGSGGVDVVVLDADAPYGGFYIRMGSPAVRIDLTQEVASVM